MKQAINTSIIAAIDGNTAELTKLAGEFAELALDVSLSKSERLNHLEDMLFLAELAAIRKDKRAMHTSLYVLERYDLELTKGIFKRAYVKSWKVYSFIQNKRDKRNLVVFDQSVDPLTRRQIDEPLKSLPNPYGWAKKHINNIE